MTSYVVTERIKHDIIDSYPSATPTGNESSLTVSLLALKSRCGIPNGCPRQSDQSQDRGISDHQPTEETERDLLHHSAGHFLPTKRCEPIWRVRSRGEGQHKELNTHIRQPMPPLGGPHAAILAFRFSWLKKL